MSELYQYSYNMSIYKHIKTHFYSLGADLRIASIRSIGNGLSQQGHKNSLRAFTTTLSFLTTLT